jgi:hypothetical protein
MHVTSRVKIQQDEVTSSKILTEVTTIQPLKAQWLLYVPPG